MGFSDSDSSKCRKHPNEKQHPGVCSACLRERLSKISNTPSFSSTYRTSVVSHSSTPPLSSATSAAGNRLRRNGSDTYASAASVFNDGLKKSRSVSCAPLSRSRGGANISDNKIEKRLDENSNSKRFGIGRVEENGGEKRKKGGFLKRIIHSTGKKA